MSCREGGYFGKLNINLVPKSSTAPKARVKAWHSKSKLGCRTCKKRRVKCDEGKPTCQRCAKIHLQCDGYDPPPKTWLFVSAEEASSSSPSNSEAATIGNNSLDVSPRGNSPAHTDEEIDNQIINILRNVPTSPYRRPKAQYYLKYFLEIVGRTFARANVSIAFWLSHFPQLAWHGLPTRYTLYAMSASFESFSRNSLAGSVIYTPDPEATALESQAMRLVATQSSTVEETLAASLGFWMTSVFTGDYERALHHNLFTQKIVTGTSAEDLKNRDPQMFGYCAALSRTFLECFRTMRGPCPIHSDGESDDVAKCEPSCFTLDHSISREVRIVDGLHHLRQVMPRIERCKTSLLAAASQFQQHPHHAALLRLLDIHEADCEMLINRWQDPSALGLRPLLTKKELAVLPCTMSPFEALFDELDDAIIRTGESDQAAFDLASFDLRLRVTIPSLILASSKGYVPILADSLALAGTPAWSAKPMGSSKNFGKPQFR